MLQKQKQIFPLTELIRLEHGCAAVIIFFYSALHNLTLPSKPKCLSNFLSQYGFPFTGFTRCTMRSLVGSYGGSFSSGNLAVKN
jgi:hypothetical protein